MLREQGREEGELISGGGGGDGLIYIIFITGNIFIWFIGT